MLAYFLIILAILLVFCDILRRRRKCFQKLPNGPTGLPVIGNILQLGLKPHLKLSKWAEEFGRYYTIDILGKPTIVINDLKTMRDILGNLNSTGKYTLPTLDITMGADYGIANTEGSVWFEQQKFFMKILRQYGFHGGNQLNPVILHECNNLCNWIDNELKQKQTTSMILNETLLQSVANIVWSAVTGEEHTTYNENNIGTLVGNQATEFNNASVLTFMPWLRFIAPELSGWNKLVKASSEFREQVQNGFEKRKLARSHNKEDRFESIIDAYLDQAENCNDANSTFYGENGMKHAFFGVVNILVAGSETTSSNITWLVYYLLAYPDVQRKVQNEMDAVLREEEQNSIAIDKTRLPYLEAVILEVLRITSLIPLGVMHKLLDDITYEDFTLAKGTYLLANLYHAHMDPNVWRDPETFRPERFLEGSQTERRRLKDYVVAFQEGRRKCPGEHFAKDMTFWYAFTLMDKFSFHKEESRNVKEYLKPVSGFMFLPPKLGVVVRKKISRRFDICRFVFCKMHKLTRQVFY